MTDSTWIRPIDRGTLTNSVMDAIKEMILGGGIKPGDQLPSQAELAEGFGVGLSTVREAVRGLALMGIVEPQPGRGTRICVDAPVTLRILDIVRTRSGTVDPRKIYEARTYIEVDLTGLAAERATGEDIAKIQDALDRMEQSLEDDAAYIEADIEFHRAVAEAAKNGLMADYLYIARQMLGSAIPQVVGVPGIKQSGLEMQQRILEAIRDGDAQAARQYALENVTSWSDVYLKEAENSDGA